MKKTCILIICLFTIKVASGQKALRVLDWKAEQTVNTFLLSKLHRQYDERRDRFNKALVSHSTAIAYRDSCRSGFRKIIGDLPARTSLNPQVTGTIIQNGYRIEKVIYESVPGHHVTANLYLPEGTGVFPAVLFFCGHEDDAKATDSYQRTAIHFALNGFVVLVIDPVSQAERHQLTDNNHSPLTRGGTTEHTLINAVGNLVGSGTVAFQLWDNVRGLDYLETRPEVDKDRIGCLGNSGGGTQAAYLMAYDDRVKVAAPCSFVASRERNFEWFGPNDGCQHVPYEGVAQLEISDFLIMFAPKPVLVLSGKYDFVDYYGTTKAFHEVASLYKTIGAENNAHLFTAEDGHGISMPKREAAVLWFRKWFYNDSTIRKEGGYNVLSKEVLSSSGAAQVVAKFPDARNDIDRSMAIAKSYSKKRGNKLDLKQRIQLVLHADVQPGQVKADGRGAVDYKGRSYSKVIVRKENQIPLPVLLIKPEGSPDGVVLWVHQRGKQALADSAALIGEYLRQGRAVVLADITGTGELKDPEIVNDPKYFNTEYRNAMLGLHVGLPVVTLRTMDIVALVDFISSDATLKNKPLEVYAQGICSLAALHAAVLDKRIGKLHYVSGIDSFFTIMETPRQWNWYSYVLPGVLLHYDVSDLLTSLTTRVTVE